MNRATAAKHLPMIQAFIAGADLDYHAITYKDGRIGWEQTDNPTFEDGSEYRIRPKPAAAEPAPAEPKSGK